MRSRLAGNGLYESSRMIIPEHREGYNRLMDEQERRGKPVLDEQEIERIERAIIDSYNRRCIIEMVVFNPFYDEEIKGIVVSLNTSTHDVKLKLGEGYRFVNLAEILSASI